MKEGKRSPDRPIGSRSTLALIAGWAAFIYRGKMRHGGGIHSEPRLSRCRAQSELLFYIHLNHVSNLSGVVRATRSAIVHREWERLLFAPLPVWSRRLRLR